MATYPDMTLISLLEDSVVANFETNAFRNAVEDHLQLLKAGSGAQTVNAADIDAVVFEGDLYGLFSKIGIEKRIRWTAMRMNGYTSPQEYAGDRTIFVIPDIDVMDRLAQAVASRQGLQH